MRWQCSCPGGPHQCRLADLDADQTSELILIAGSYAPLYARDAQRWRQVGIMRTPATRGSKDLTAATKAGDIEVQEPRWRELNIGGHAFSDAWRQP